MPNGRRQSETLKNSFNANRFNLLSYIYLILLKKSLLSANRAPYIKKDMRLCLPWIAPRGLGMYKPPCTSSNSAPRTSDDSHKFKDLHCVYLL